uniref:Mitochondrial nucleoid factor 1 n=2 Tax=Sinocyclocheilus TaxID=75365 RepID=A0A673JB91_9TELE
MAATRYRRFLKLCEEWPNDESKKGRDLGTFLRQRVASAFREGENTQVLPINSQASKRDGIVMLVFVCFQFPRAKDTSFTGVTVEECRILLATGNMQHTDEEKKGLWKTLMERFSSKPEDGTPEKAEK